MRQMRRMCSSTACAKVNGNNTLKVIFVRKTWFPRFDSEKPLNDNDDDNDDDDDDDILKFKIFIHLSMGKIHFREDLNMLTVLSHFTQQRKRLRRCQLPRNL
uniref:Uncharacterized protein n=1 Tax=Glossina pallidipes TaxID=7398 RepID=A0A1B0A336_GLOPL